MDQQLTPVIFKAVDHEAELHQILKLQQINLPKNISKQESVEQGFVTVEHNFPLLANMNKSAPQIIATTGKEVVGYALVMLESFADQIPVLIPMFEKLATLHYEGKSFREYRYYVMGQVCVGKGFRGRGLFDGMYHEQRRQLSGKYDFVVTEVATRNTRSMRAHERVGFKTIHVYDDPDHGEEWAIILWDWK